MSRSVEEKRSRLEAYRYFPGEKRGGWQVYTLLFFSIHRMK
jgi:hypothetical protein